MFDLTEQRLSEVLRADLATEVFLNGPTISYLLFRDGSVQTIDNPFKDALSMRVWLQDYAYNQGLRLDPRIPACGGSSRDGMFRWHACLQEIAPEGPLLSFRKIFVNDFGLSDFDISLSDLEAIESILSSQNILLVSGPTGVGKTSFMSALLKKFCFSERLIILEQQKEIMLKSPLWIRLISKNPDLEDQGSFDISKLIVEALRLKPDRFVIGEVRGEEAPLVLEAALTGHLSVVASIHGTTPTQALSRLKNLCCDHRKSLDHVTIARILKNLKVSVLQVSNALKPKVSLHESIL